VYWQQREIYREAVVSDETSTVVIDLPRSNVLSGLLVNIRATNGSVAGAQYMPAMISRIEVIADGSKELFSMTGEEAFFMTYALTGKIPPCDHSLAADAAQRSCILIPFGRILGDSDYYLDCATYTSLELRITFNATVADTGIVDNSLYLEVLGLMAMEGAPAPRRGTFKTSRKYNFTSEAAGDVTLDLPRANLYRRLGVIVFGEDKLVGAIYSRVALDVNNGEKVIYAGRTAGQYYKSFIELAMEGYLDDSADTDVTSKLSIPATMGDILVIPFDVGNDMDNCLNSAAYDKVTLTLTQATADVETSIILQEVLT